MPASEALTLASATLLWKVLPGMTTWLPCSSWNSHSSLYNGSSIRRQRCVSSCWGRVGNPWRAMYPGDAQGTL
ncbi:hypothetical protein D3C78_1880780 [compost metagenome]